MSYAWLPQLNSDGEPVSMVWVWQPDFVGDIEPGKADPYPAANPSRVHLDLIWSNPGASWWNRSVSGGTAYKLTSPSGGVETLVRMPNGSIGVELPADVADGGAVKDSGPDLIGQLVQIAVPVIIGAGIASGFTSLPSFGSDFVGPVMPGQSLPAPSLIDAPAVSVDSLPSLDFSSPPMPPAVAPVPESSPMLDLFRESIDFQVPPMPPAVSPLAPTTLSSLATSIKTAGASLATTLAKALAPTPAASPRPTMTAAPQAGMSTGTMAIIGLVLALVLR